MQSVIKSNKTEKLARLLMQHTSPNQRSYCRPRLIGKYAVDARGVSGCRSQNELLQIALYDHVLDRSHCDLEEVRIGGIREMTVDLLLWIPVQSTELVHEVFAGLLPVIWRTVVVCEAVLCDRVSRQLLLEEIHFVEEKDQGRLGEPMGVGNRFPEHQRLVHLILEILLARQAL